MVAYGFKPRFVQDIQSGLKQQTIRLPRRRHARPGEPVQLYQGLRTKSCRKIVPDPVCIGVDEVLLDLRGAGGPRSRLGDSVHLVVNGIPIAGAAADAYAAGDGFGRPLLCDVAPKGQPLISPFALMCGWWLHVHGPVLFEGVAIRWAPHNENTGRKA